MKLRNSLLMVLAVVSLYACGGGAPTTVNPNTTPPTVQDYTGPAPGTADVQAFRINLWDNIKASNRCGGCHNATGQTPRFARNDDVNLAYADANGVVNLSQPDQSRMVLKVAGGHNCWLTSAQACGDILTTWIRNWAGSVATGGKKIQLVAPPAQDVGSSKSFPADANLYKTTIWPLVTTLPSSGGAGCVRCHSPNAATPQSPFFASFDARSPERIGRGGLRGGEGEDQSRHAVAVTPRRATAGRVAQLLDQQLRGRCGRDAGAGHGLRERHPADPGRPCSSSSARRSSFTTARSPPVATATTPT